MLERKALVSLCICVGLPEPLLLNNAMELVPKSRVLAHFTNEVYLFCLACLHMDKLSGIICFILSYFRRRLHVSHNEYKTYLKVFSHPGQ